jgi:outer membrane protein OmpA-like peptidoglycan-associated protein
MKIKLQPGGKLIVVLFFLIIFYLLLSLTGIFGIFSSKEKKAIAIDTTKTALRLPERAIRIGFVTGNTPENLNSANGGKETASNSIFHNLGLKASLIECKNFDELAAQLKIGGDNGGIDIAYCNITQLIQKANHFKASDAKCFLLSDITTEKNYIISNKDIKNIRDLNKRKISLCDLNSSLYSVSLLAQKNNADGMNIDITSSDKESFDKLTRNQVSAAVIKDKNILDDIKANKNFKVLSEVHNRLPNLLLTSSSTQENYYAYLKTVAKCCLLSSDSLKAIKGFYDNINFADIKGNISYLIDIDKNGKTAFKIETDEITNNIKRYLPALETLNSSDLVFGKVISELSPTKSINNVDTHPNKIDTGHSKDGSGIVLKTKKNTEHLNKSVKISSTQDETLKTKKQAGVSKTKPIPKTEKKEITKPKSGSHKMQPTVVKDKKTDVSFDNNYKIINFDPNSAKIDSLADRKLSVIGKDIQTTKVKEIQLIGHTDSTGEESYNLILSKKRAESVMEYLSKNFGIDKNLFRTSGKGSKEPLGKNSDKKWKKLNRRVNIIIKNKN